LFVSQPSVHYNPVRWPYRIIGHPCVCGSSKTPTGTLAAQDTPAASAPSPDLLIDLATDTQGGGPYYRLIGTSSLCLTSSGQQWHLAWWLNPSYRPLQISTGSNPAANCISRLLGHRPRCQLYFLGFWGTDPAANCMSRLLGHRPRCQLYFLGFWGTDPTANSVSPTRLTDSPSLATDKRRPSRYGTLTD
jgi:hypothetical protein